LATLFLNLLSSYVIFEQLTELLEQGSDVWEKLSQLKASSRDKQLTAISTFMPGFKNLCIRRKPRLHMSIDKGGENLNVAQLSQNEKSLMALIGTSNFNMTRIRDVG